MEVSGHDLDIVELNKAKLMLARAKTLESVIEIRDRSSALAAYAHAKGAGEAYLRVTEIKLWVERKAGQFVKEMEKHEGGRSQKTGNTVLPVSSPKLKDLGIDKMESVRWQKIAAIPEAKFEEYLADTEGWGTEVVSAAEGRCLLEGEEKWA